MRIVILGTLALLWTIMHWFILAFDVIKQNQKSEVDDLKNAKLKYKAKSELYNDSVIHYKDSILKSWKYF